MHFIVKISCICYCSSHTISVFWVIINFYVVTFFGQVKFAPHQHSKLISAAVDGLICVFDTDGDMNEDNRLLSVCFSCFLCPNALSYISCYVRLWFDTLMFVVYWSIPLVLQVMFLCCFIWRCQMRMMFFPLFVTSITGHVCNMLLFVREVHDRAYNFIPHRFL